MSNATPGGAKLRALREGSHKTQLAVELEADLGTGYLQRVESGRVAQPGRGTLERILGALDARYSERREIMEIFGYTVSTPPPSEADIAWASEISRHEIDEVPFPAYVLDCTHRLIIWNRYFPRLLGVAEGSLLLDRLAGESALAPWFDPDSPLGQLVSDPQSFLPALIRALRYEMRQFHREPWYSQMLQQLSDDLPLFRRYWEIVEQEPPAASAARAVVPVLLDVPGAGTLQFRLSSERFTRDSRFRSVYYFPADPHTMRTVAEWATA